MINMHSATGGFENSLHMIQVEENIWMNVSQQTVTVFSIKLIIKILNH